MVVTLAFTLTNWFSYDWWNTGNCICNDCARWTPCKCQTKWAQLNPSLPCVPPNCFYWLLATPVCRHVGNRLKNWDRVECEHRFHRSKQRCYVDLYNFHNNLKFVTKIFFIDNNGYLTLSCINLAKRFSILWLYHTCYFTVFYYTLLFYIIYR